MRQSVRDEFLRFTVPLEGAVPFLYLDARGLVTVAIGNLVDPMVAALSLPLVHQDGTPADAHAIQADWGRVKARQDLAKAGGLAFKDVAQLRLTDDGMREIVEGKLDQVDRYLAQRFEAWEEWPAPAQLATLSMAWACGPAFKYPKMEAALKARDFATAANECLINPNVGTIVKRNARNRLLYSMAACAQTNGGDFDAIGDYSSAAG